MTVSVMLAAETDAAAMARLRAAETIGRPIGTPDFLARLEAQTERKLAAQKRGRKGRADQTIA